MRRTSGSGYSEWNLDNILKSHAAPAREIAAVMPDTKRLRVGVVKCNVIYL